MQLPDNEVEVMLFPLLVRPISTCWTWFELTCEALRMSHQEPPAHQYKCKALTHWDGLVSQTSSYHVGRVLVNSSCPMQHVGWSWPGGWDITMQPYWGWMRH